MWSTWKRVWQREELECMASKVGKSWHVGAAERGLDMLPEQRSEVRAVCVASYRPQEGDWVFF